MSVLIRPILAYQIVRNTNNAGTKGRKGIGVTEKLFIFVNKVGIFSWSEIGFGYFATHHKQTVSKLLKLNCYEEIIKITLRDVNSHKILTDSEMKNIFGGYGSGAGESGEINGSGVAKGCSDHTEPNACFGECAEIVGEKLLIGKCEWKAFPELRYAGCVW